MQRGQYTPPEPTPEPASAQFVSSGSQMLDLALGGGWAQGRISNVVGDKSAGKTGLAIEACANFALISSVKCIRYAESESAFDDDYAQIVGMPDGLSTTGGIQTVEDFHDDLEEFLKSQTSGDPCLYVMDSLDALSDEAEMARPIGEGSYGGSKPKKMSELFRRLTAKARDANCHLMIISQIRDKIGVTFGETKTRTGGRALDFYASQIVWLSEIAKLKRTVLGIDRIYGITSKARVRKNKVGKPHREAEMQIIFDYGIDDEISMLEWLTKAKAENLLSEKADVIKKRLSAARRLHDYDMLDELKQELRAATHKHWMRIEEMMEPPVQKYSR